MKNFLIRKVIHIFSGLILILACVTIQKSAYYLGGIMVMLLFLEILRFRLPIWKNIYENLFVRLLNPDEKQSLFTGAISLWITIYLIYVFFPAKVFLTASLILVLADPLAAFSGRVIQTHKIYQNKTLMGSLVFFVTGFILIWRYSNILCLIELYSPKIWENLFIGSAGAIILMLFDKLS
jgi:dolichol kinase